MGKRTNKSLKEKYVVAFEMHHNNYCYAHEISNKTNCLMLSLYRSHHTMCEFGRVGSYTKDPTVGQWALA